VIFEVWFVRNGPAWLIDTVRGWRGICTPFRTGLVRTSPVLVLCSSETVDGGLIRNLGSGWHEMALFVLQTQQDGALRHFGSSLHETAPFGSWTLV